MAEKGQGQPVGEFEPLSAADVQLYLTVMRTAADRVKNMSPADRQVLKTFRKMTTSSAGQMPTPEQMAAMQRAPELMAMDAVVARELGVSKRFSSISNRMPFMGMRPGQGSGDGDEPPMTPEQKAQLKSRIERFAERRKLDAAAYQPYEAEINALQRQVNLMLHPENIPE